MMGWSRHIGRASEYAVGGRTYVLLDHGILDLDQLRGEALEARHLEVGTEVLVHGLRARACRKKGRETRENKNTHFFFQ